MKKNTLSVALLATLIGLASCSTKDITPAPNMTGTGTSNPPTTGGTSTLPVRFGAPPDLWLLTLRGVSRPRS